MKIFLLVNAVLYFALAVLCTVRHLQTSRGSGYVQLDAAGHSEYLVIYGGLQLGLALFIRGDLGVDAGQRVLQRIQLREQGLVTQRELVRLVLVMARLLAGLIEYAAVMFRTGLFPPNNQSILCSERYCARWAACKFHE